jgi:hypothetical protein
MTDLRYRFRDQTNGVDVIPVTSYYSQTNSTTFTRISVTLTIPAGCTSFRFSPIADSNSIGTCFITSAQVEVGAYATSYIPTTSASVTRNADVISRDNVFTNGLTSLSGATWFVDLKNNRTFTRDGVTNGGIYFTNVLNNFNNGIIIFNGATNTRLAVRLFQGGSIVSTYNTTSDSVKLAIKWNGTTADIFANGVKVVSAVSFTLTQMQFISTPSVNVPLNINSMALFPTPLTDTQCIALTSI